MPANPLPARTDAPTPAAAAGETLSFEAAMERLESIVEQMENARLPLEELIRGYEEGTRLIRVCSERLSAAEQRIEIITRDAAGQPRAAEYVPPPPASAAANTPNPPAAATTPKPPPEPKTLPPATPPVPSTSRSSKNTNEVSLF